MKHIDNKKFNDKYIFLYKKFYFTISSSKKQLTVIPQVFIK